MAPPPRNRGGWAGPTIIILLGLCAVATYVSTQMSELFPLRPTGTLLAATSTARSTTRGRGQTTEGVAAGDEEGIVLSSHGNATGFDAMSEGGGILGGGAIALPLDGVKQQQQQQQQEQQRPRQERQEEGGDERKIAACNKIMEQVEAELFRSLSWEAALKVAREDGRGCPAVGLVEGMGGIGRSKILPPSIHSSVLSLSLFLSIYLSIHPSIHPSITLTLSLIRFLAHTCPRPDAWAVGEKCASPGGGCDKPGDDAGSIEVTKPSSLIPHPSTLNPHPSTLDPHPSSIIQHLLTLAHSMLLHLLINFSLIHHPPNTRNREPSKSKASTMNTELLVCICWIPTSEPRCESTMRHRELYPCCRRTQPSSGCKTCQGSRASTTGG